VFLQIDWRLTCLLVGVVISTLDSSVITIALPTLSETFKITANEAQMATSVYLLASAVTFIPLSAFANIWGTGKVFRVSLLAFTGLSLGLALAPTFHILLLLRCLQGIAGAGIVGLVPGLAAAIYPEPRAFALSLVISASSAGTLLGPAIGGIAIQYLGWQSIFLLNLPLGILAFSLSNHLPNLETLNLQTGLSGLVAVPKFFLALVSSLLFFVHTFGTIVIISFYLSSLQYTPSKIGFLLLVPSLITLLLSAWSGTQADRYGWKNITILGTTILIVSSCWQGLTKEILPGVIGMGFGRCFFQATNSAKILSLAPKGADSLASCFLSIARVFGQALGSIIGGWLWTNLAFDNPHLAFAIANVVLAFSAWLAGVFVYVP
jgi:MFS transporter, DHA2 family, multidrug resistance protein